MSSWIPTAAATAEILFLLLTVAAVVVRLHRSAMGARRKRLLAGAMLASVLFKIGLASLGHNYDVDTWRLLGNLVERGLSVYANTDRNNWGPVWAWLVSGFGRLAGPATGEVFHMWTAAFLAAVDILMALVIAEAYSWVAAMVFILSPIGLIISGLHSQFDNLAVLLALFAWLSIRSGKPRIAMLLASSVELGLSLTVKHVFFLFPVWLLFWRPLGKLRHRILYMGIAYGLFAGSFLPWWGDPVSRAGIVGSVFGYSSVYGQSWLGYAIEVFMPIASFDAFLKWIPVFGGLKALWMVLMMGGGMALAIRGTRDLFIFYVMLLYASSPALAGQYAAIPMVAAGVFCAAWESWAFLAAGSFGNLFTSSHASILLHRKLPELVISGHVYFATAVFDEYLQPFFLIASQFCIGVLLVRQWRNTARPTTRSVGTEIGQAAALIVVGGLPVVLAKKVMAYFAGFLMS